MDRSNSNDLSEPGSGWILVDNGNGNIEVKQRNVTTTNDEQEVTSSTNDIPETEKTIEKLISFCIIYTINANQFQYLFLSAYSVNSDISSSLQNIDETIDNENLSSFENKCKLIKKDNCNCREMSSLPEPYRHNVNSNEKNKNFLQTRLNSTIILAIIAGVSAIISASSIQILLPSSSETAQLSQRIDQLENDNVAMRLEINRLVDLVHRVHCTNSDNKNIDKENFIDCSAIKQSKRHNQNNYEKRVWMGDGPLDIDITTTLNTEQKKSVQKCSSESITDDLFADYNAKKCQRHDSSKDSSKYSENIVKNSQNDFAFPFVEDKKKVLRNRSDEFVNDKNIKYSNFKGETNKYKKNNDFINSEPKFRNKDNYYGQKQQKLPKPKKEQQNQKKRKVFVDFDDSIDDWYGKMMKNREIRRSTKPAYKNPPPNPPKDQRFQRI